MICKENKAEEVHIAYIGGGSRGWAWSLMSDLASCDKMSGDVYLYDIDYEAACHNEWIGNQFIHCEGARSTWHYHAVRTAEEALMGADFVVISILPGTFDEMESDVHTPEKYGIYQSVGDTSGPGGILRAMRAVPMIEEIAENIRCYCPDAWVINYTNPMTMCVRTLYRVFPEIKAFGCCHEVFGTQELLSKALEICRGISGAQREDISVNPVGVNHYTWLTKARYRNLDLFPVYAEFVERYGDTGFTEWFDEHWRESPFCGDQKVKMDLFRRYGYIAAAGDRHLAEFCEGKWYLADPQTVYDWGFALTSVSYRKKDLASRLQRSRALRSGELPVTIQRTGEEGVHQMCAILGFGDRVTNVNLPNRGQISNLPLGAVVETNAVFRAGSVTPVMAGPIPSAIYPLLTRVCGAQEALNEAIASRDGARIFSVFCQDPLVTCSLKEAKKLFLEMVDHTKAYLTSYDFSGLS